MGLCGGGGGSSNQTVTTNLLPDYAQPYVIAYLNKMTELSNTGYATYPGATYAEQNTDELDGITALANRGTNGNALIAAGTVLLSNILDGLKINTNTKVDEYYIRQAEAVIKEFEEITLPSLNQRFNMSGNYGSLSHNWAQAKAAESVMSKLQDIGLNTYFQDYLSERSLQVDGLGHTVNYANQSISDAELLKKTGEFEREYSQGYLENEYKKFHDELTKIVKRHELLGNGVRAIVGAQTEVTSPLYRPSPFASIAGIAMAGIGIYGMMQGMRKTSVSQASGVNGFIPQSNDALRVNLPMINPLETQPLFELPNISPLSGR